MTRAIEIDTSLFLQWQFDSASIGPLSYVAHQWDREGVYCGQVVQGKIDVASFRLRVCSSAELHEVQIDLAKVAGLSTPPHLSVVPGGWSVFFASQKESFHVRVRGKRRADFFDSRKLGRGDAFSVTLVRTGEYAVRSETGKRRRGLIEVVPPRKTKSPYRVPNAKVFSFASSGLSPKTYRAKLGQSVVFQLDGPQRVLVGRL